MSIWSAGSFDNPDLFSIVLLPIFVGLMHISWIETGSLGGVCLWLAVLVFSAECLSLCHLALFERGLLVADPATNEAVHWAGTGLIRFRWPDETFGVSRGSVVLMVRSIPFDRGGSILLMVNAGSQSYRPSFAEFVIFTHWHTCVSNCCDWCSVDGELINDRLFRSVDGGLINDLLLCSKDGESMIFLHCKIEKKYKNYVLKYMSYKWYIDTCELNWPNVRVPDRNTVAIKSLIK